MAIEDVERVADEAVKAHQSSTETPVALSAAALDRALAGITFFDVPRLKAAAGSVAMFWRDGANQMSAEAERLTVEQQMQVALDAEAEAAKRGKRFGASATKTGGPSKPRQTGGG